MREIDCRPPLAVAIEPSLRLQSPENGNICGAGRRLSAVGPAKTTKWEGGDRRLGRESPLLAGLSHAPQDTPTTGGLAGWRCSGIRTRLQREFPANREFSREIQDFRGLTADFEERSACAAVTFCGIPCANNRENNSRIREFFRRNWDFGRTRAMGPRPRLFRPAFELTGGKAHSSSRE